MKTEDCELKIDAAQIACNLEDKTVTEVKRSIGIRERLKESFPEISDFATNAVLELGKRENKKDLPKIIVALRKKGKGKKRLTKREVKNIIQNVRHEDKKPVPLPENKYNIILCDPPWRYQFVETESRAIENQYPSMELDEIDRIENVANFCKQHGEISPLSTDAVKVLMAETDPETQSKAILSVSKLIKSKKNPKTGKFESKTRPTKKDVKKVILLYWFKQDNPHFFTGP